MSGRTIEEAMSIAATRSACGFGRKCQEPLTDAPDALGWDRAQWESFSPGMRREIERDMRRRGEIDRVKGG